MGIACVNRAKETDISWKIPNEELTAQFFMRRTSYSLIARVEDKDINPYKQCMRDLLSSFSMW